jgi:hypothetical protein
MTAFLATIGADAQENWQIAKQEGLWGVKAQGKNFTSLSHAQMVTVGDSPYFWRTRPRQGGGTNGILAKVEALGPLRLVSDGGVHVPWEPKDLYVGVFPMRLVQELPEPVGGSFTDRVSDSFGFSNTVVLHGFERLEPSIAERIDQVF